MDFGFPVVVLAKETRFIRDAIEFIYEVDHTRNRGLKMTVD